jgi:hypothetical protein
LQRLPPPLVSGAPQSAPMSRAELQIREAQNNAKQ